jgi:CubicO group peptidase (beta-lactamase class C family)
MHFSVPSAPLWFSTVRHLLTHTAGISNGLYAQINMRQDYSEDELVKKTAALPLESGA